MGQWSRATFDQRWEEHPLQDWELRPFGGPWTLIEYQHELLLDIASTGLFIKSANSRSNEEATRNCSEEAAGNSSEGLSEWLEDVTENLEIIGMPAATNISQDLGPERLIKVAPTKHSIDTHFPKDQNCEVCKRNTTTRAYCRRRPGTAVPRAEKSGLSWYKILPLSGYNLIRVRTRIRRRRGFTKVSRTVKEAKSYLH